MNGNQKTAALVRRLLPGFGGWFGGLCLVAVLAVSGCAGAPTGGTVVDKAAIVARIAQSRWDALIRGDAEAAYNMMSPASRSMVSLEVFRKKASLVTWKAASIKKVECSADDLCTAQVTATYAYQLRRGGVVKGVENEQVLTEKWRNTDGGWWYVHADAL